MVSKTYYRYIWLFELLLRCNRPLSFDEIQHSWQESPMNNGSLSLRTFHEHRKGITEMFGVEIVCEKGGWNSVYSIKNPEVLKDNQLGQWLLDHYSVPQDFATFYGMRDRILLEDIARGNQDYHPIIEAMKQNVEMEIDYQKYDGHHQTFHVQPYALKVYNRRWYLLGFVKERGELRTIALDRMQHMTLTDTHFEMPKDFDARTHFANVVGIFVDEAKPVEKVRIRVHGVQVEYLRALPLHKSQEEVLTRYEEGYSEFTYRLCLTPELTSQLLAMGDSVEVIEPLKLREEIKEKINNMVNFYK